MKVVKVGNTVFTACKFGQKTELSLVEQDNPNFVARFFLVLGVGETDFQTLKTGAELNWEVLQQASVN